MSTSEREYQPLDPEWTPAHRDAREYQHYCHVLSDEDGVGFVDTHDDHWPPTAWISADPAIVRDLEVME